MSTTPLQMPSPCSTEVERGSSVPAHSKAPASNVKMLDIHSLLNPSADEHDRLFVSTVSPPLTPAYTSQGSSPASTPVPEMPNSLSPTKRQKLVKDAAVFVRGTPKGLIKYPPYESTEYSLCLSALDQQELAKQHKRFDIIPSGQDDQGLIADYARHIPYSSEKKSFFGKTKRDAFEVFQYTFRVPGDAGNRQHLVMWDYQIGLVRITPFFKALNYSKTTPAKALSNNAGLKELSHSITGGSLAAQGYWLPYSCARAICLTFCHDIRWALTPIFGPNFLGECLPPEHPAYGAFKISSKIVQGAQLEAEGFRSCESSRSTSPVATCNKTKCNAPDMPRSVPEPALMQKHLRPRPTFKPGSPFLADSNSSDDDHDYQSVVIESPELSPKSKRHAHPVNSGRASIIRRRNSSLISAPPNNTPVNSLSQCLLMEPHPAPTTSWRGLNGHTRSNRVLKMPTGTHDKLRVHKSKRYTAADARAAQWLLNLHLRDSQLTIGPNEVRGVKRKLSNA